MARDDRSAGPRLTLLVAMAMYADPGLAALRAPTRAFEVVVESAPLTEAAAAVTAAVVDLS